jgi:hypothetical protein
MPQSSMGKQVIGLIKWQQRQTSSCSTAHTLCITAGIDSLSWTMVLRHDMQRYLCVDERDSACLSLAQPVYHTDLISKDALLVFGVSSSTKSEYQS